MTIEELWEDYRRLCCPPELGETTKEIYLQRQAYLCGVAATIGEICRNPECFRELQESISEWIVREYAGKD